MKFQNKEQAIAWAKKENIVIGFWKQKILQLGYFATMHPGGEQLILNAQNKDIYQLYNTNHKHLPISQNIAINLSVATLKNEPISQKKSYFNINKPLSQQVRQATPQQYLNGLKFPLIRKQKIRIFSSDFMQWFTYNSWYSVIFAHFPVTLFFLYLGLQTLIAQGLFLFALYFIFGGLIIWTFAEYNLHRFIFHFQKYLSHRWTFLRQIHFGLHGVHHLIPMDLDRIIFPTPIGLLIESFLFLVFFSCFTHNRAFVIAAGFDFCYMSYQLIHYFMHRVSLNILKGKRRYHNIHHYSTKQINYGVSNDIYDRIFGTFEKP